MDVLTDAESKALLDKWRAAGPGEVDPIVVLATVETLLAARLAEQREQIATAMREEFADRIEWGDGTPFICTDDAARIARNHGAAT